MCEVENSPHSSWWLVGVCSSTTSGVLTAQLFHGGDQLAHLGVADVFELQGVQLGAGSYVAHQDFRVALAILMDALHWPLAQHVGGGDHPGQVMVAVGDKTAGEWRG